MDSAHTTAQAVVEVLRARDSGAARAPGAAAEHTEHWFLFKGVDIGATEAALDAAISPLVAQTAPK